MPPLDAASMGARIAEARGRASLTQAQLAAATSLDRSALAKIENGTRRVTALELARIAEAVEERIEWFVTDAPPAIVSHRNMLDPGTPSAAIDRLIERLAREVEFLVRHDDRLTLPEVTGLDRPSNGDEAELMANRARELMGVDSHQPLLGLADAAARVGILTFALELGTGAADAASVLLAPGAVAVVNGTLRVGRRRLALAHEIGHCLFADEYTVDSSIAEHTENDLWEARLDRFARALLLPRRALGQAWGELRARDDVRTAAVKLASGFRVDMSTLARRLVELAQIDSVDAQSIRRVTTTRGDIVELNLVVDDELAPPFLPRPYVESVLRLYRSSTVSAARATDLLLDTWAEEDLPVLPALPDDAIWGAIR